MKGITFDDEDNSRTPSGQVMYDMHVAEMKRWEGVCRNMHKAVPSFADIFYAPCTGPLALDDHLEENLLVYALPSQFLKSLKGMANVEFMPLFLLLARNV